MKLLAVLAVLALIATGLYIITPTTDAGPPTTTAPPAPKTRAQIANEAYAIEASVKAIAGRKTDPSNDGIGATTDYTFTSTADFDAGAKSASSGNYDVETLTDNLQISSGSLEMSNLKSDRFTLDDSDAVTRKWANDIGGGSGVCSTVTVSSGVASLAAVNAGSAKDCDLVSQSTFSGDWDVRVKVIEVSGTFNTAVICMITTKECTSTVDRAYTGSASGVFIRHLIGTLTVWKVSSGTVTQQGSGVSVAAGTFWLRLTRSSTTYTAYHSSDGSTWTQDVQFTDSGPSATRYGGFGMFRNGDAYGSEQTDFDEWNTASGILDGGGWASSGGWKSASNTATTETFKSITISYSGDSGEYVSAVTLFDSGGRYFFIDNTHLTSGTSHTYTVSETDGLTWKVGVNMTSGGSGTAVVFSVTVTTTGGLGTYTGCAPNPSGMTCTTNSTWDQSKIKLCGPQEFDLSETDPSLTLTVTNSSIDGCGLAGVFNTTDSTSTPVYLWDGVHAVTYTFRNSTFFNFTRLIVHYNVAANYRVGATVIRFDNDTFYDFGGTVFTENQAVARTVLLESHDITASGYNRDDDSSCVLSDNPTNTPYEETLNSTLYRSRFIDLSGHLTGCVMGNAVRAVRDNYFEGGFLQVVYGADFEHGFTPDFGSPTEVVNWSHNYANGSKHTVFGFYGTGTDSLGSLHVGLNAYGTVYGNYVNNSRYIPIQSGGNQTSFRIIGNYVRGPLAWPGGIPTFEEAIGLNGRVHGYLLDHNYIFDMPSFREDGIVIGFAVYDIMMTNNVLYDVGNPFVVSGMTFKWSTTSPPTLTSASDYSWKGTRITIAGNYISGVPDDAVFIIDSGYVRLIGNVVVGTTASIDVQAGWTPGANPYVWVDWIDGFPNEPVVTFPSVMSEFESHYWVRSARTGSLKISGALTVDVTSSDPSHFGSLAPACVAGDQSGSDQHASADEILRWTGQACGAVTDTVQFVGSGTFSALEPERFYNISASHSFLPVVGNVSGGSQYVVKEPGSYVGNLGNPWNIKPGHNYAVSGFVAGYTEGLPNAINAIWVFIYFAVLMVIVAGAVIVRKKLRGGGGKE